MLFIHGDAYMHLLQLLIYKTTINLCVCVQMYGYLFDLFAICNVGRFAKYDKANRKNKGFKTKLFAYST